MCLQVFVSTPKQDSQNRTQHTILPTHDHFLGERNPIINEGNKCVCYPTMMLRRSCNVSSQQLGKKALARRIQEEAMYENTFMLQTGGGGGALSIIFPARKYM